MSMALAASGGPERRVEIVPLASGREARNAVWAGSRRRWDVGSAAARIESLQVLVAFFEARGGRLHGFRFRDRLDFTSGEGHAAPSPTDQPIGTGDGAAAVFPLTKAYGDWRRRIWKPVAGSVRAAVNGSEVAVTADPATGLVTFEVAPPAGSSVTAGFTFDCPVRFDTERLDVNLESFGAGRVFRVPLIELIG